MDIKKFNRLKQLKQKWEKTKDKLKQKAVKKLLEASNGRISIQETVLIAKKDLCNKCSMNVKAIILFNKKDFVKAFNDFSWCDSCHKVVKNKIMPKWDEDFAKKITKFKKK